MNETPDSGADDPRQPVSGTPNPDQAHTTEPTAGEDATSREAGSETPRSSSVGAGGVSEAPVGDPSVPESGTSAAGSGSPARDEAPASSDGAVAGPSSDSAPPSSPPVPAQAAPSHPQPSPPVTLPGAPDGTSNVAPPAPAPNTSQPAPATTDAPTTPTAPAPAPNLAPPAPAVPPATDLPALAEANPVVPTIDQIEQEVTEAMAGMSASDLAELSGALDAPVPGQPKLEQGTLVTGSVVGVSGDDVFLDFGGKDQGLVSRSQFGKKEHVEPGHRVDVLIERYDESNGVFICNRKDAIQRATWLSLQKGQRVEGRVTGMNKGGLEVDLKGIRAFMPASQVDLGFVKDISDLIGQAITCEVVELDRRAKNVLVSRRKVQEKEREEKKQTLLEELEVGQVRTGTVRNITKFGAFVDLGGVDGLVHISDLSWHQVEKVSDVLSVGQQIEVRVLKIDKERDRISLGFKQAQPDPWAGVADRYPVGHSTRAKIIRLAKFGAFAELEGGIEGLIPISEMSWSRITTPGDIVKEGDTVDVAIIRVEPDKHRLAMSMKQAQGDPWAGVLDGFQKDSQVTGKVTRIEAFGAFVELAPGIEGMIHISELSDKHVRACQDVVRVGQEVEMRILDVDAQKRRIALSIKALSERSGSAHDGAARSDDKPHKKRKRPLRGGLSGGWDW